MPPPPTSPPPGSLKRQAIHGSLWTLFGYGSSQVLRLLSNLILARLLFPEAFGLMALVNVFMQGLQMFSDVGIGPGIIQNKRGTDPLFLRTAWTIQVFRGVALWLICCAAAPAIARFFAATDPMALELRSLLPVTGLTALLGGFTATSVYTLNRKLDMRRMTLLELVPQVISLLAMALWAWWRPSVWALVGGGLVFSLVRLVMSHLMNREHHDRFGWDPAARRELFRFGRWVFLSTVVSFLATHLDRLLLGRLLNLGELGLYSIAMTLARVAIHTSSRLSVSVVFPLLARHQDEPRRLVDACLRARTAVLWASGAICSGFALFAPLFFESLYDARYAAAGGVSRWLALYTWTHVLVVSMDRIPLALGQPRLLFFANLLTTIGMAAAVAGYRLLLLPGFILGMATANVLALLFLCVTLPARQQAMLTQSLRFSLGFGLYTLGAIAALAAAQPQLGPLAHGALVCAAAALPFLPAGLRMLKLIRKPRPREATP